MLHNTVICERCDINVTYLHRLSQLSQPHFNFPVSLWFTTKQDTSVTQKLNCFNMYLHICMSIVGGCWLLHCCLYDNKNWKLAFAVLHVLPRKKKVFFTGEFPGQDENTITHLIYTLSFLTFCNLVDKKLASGSHWVNSHQWIRSLPVRYRL